jgi:hypothetical protein
MTDLDAREYSALRDVISSRGTARQSLVLAGTIGWSIALVAVIVWIPSPVASMIPLVVLAAAFETNRVLTLGVERIGRYLQVFFESDGTAGDATAPLRPPAWERTAMSFGASVPGAGGHPLHLPLFFFATLVNTFAVLIPDPVAIELRVLLVPHVSFLIWMLYCDRAMRRQRTRELERFKELRSGSALPRD